MKVATDRNRDEIVLRLDPDEARWIADLLDNAVETYGPSPTATRLRDAADRLEPAHQKDRP